MLSFASLVVFHPRASILHLLLPFTRPRRAFTCVSCKEFKAKSKRLPSDYFAMLNNYDFSYAPSPFRSVGTQKEKPSLTSRGLSQMASYLVYLTANTQSCLSYDNFRAIVSFNAAKVRILFESTKYFSKFFLGCFAIKYFAFSFAQAN